jgi:hypothetical protein
VQYAGADALAWFQVFEQQCHERRPCLAADRGGSYGHSVLGDQAAQAIVLGQHLYALPLSL